MTSLLRFARRYLVAYLPWYAAGTLLLAATNLLSVTIPLYLADGIDAIAAGSGRERLLWDAALVAVMGLGVIVVRTGSRLLFFTPGRLVEAQVKHDLFDRLMRRQPSFHDQYPTGDLVSRATSDVNTVRLLAGFTSLGVINTVVAAVTVGTQMVRISPTLAGAVAIPLIIGFGITLLFVNRLFVVMRRLQAETAALSDHVLSSFQGMATMQAFRAEPAFIDRFDHHNDAWVSTTLERARLRITIGPVLTLATSFNVFLLLWVGGPMASRGEITVGELVAFTTLVAYLSGPLRGLSFIVSLFRQAEASLERIDAVMVPALDRPDLPDPTPAPPDPPSITLDALTFRYPGSDDLALDSVSLEIPPGTTLGVIGSTGSGKTTLARCIARLVNPPPGTVKIDGIDVLDLDLDAWRRRLAYVPQRAFLFTESVRDNILLGEEDPDLLDRVLDLAALRTDLESLPDGVATEVGEGGLTLSGGQRQRVALARGLARDPSILVLDDVLSAVDHSTEHELVSAIRRQTRRPTTIIVANRVSALQHAETIAVLEGGRLVDIGTHEQLIARPGLYHDTWARQSETE
ncbi:MAG: ATP-binding cassette subfamily B multidrug efflux pump [Myxococcota bacterium]|jgi:ATP-binding cassette subfamily B multidrug efflux pump